MSIYISMKSQIRWHKCPCFRQSCGHSLQTRKLKTRQWTFMPLSYAPMRSLSKVMGSPRCRKPWNDFAYDLPTGVEYGTDWSNFDVFCWLLQMPSVSVIWGEKFGHHCGRWRSELRIGSWLVHSCRTLLCGVSLFDWCFLFGSMVNWSFPAFDWRKSMEKWTAQLSPHWMFTCIAWSYITRGNLACSNPQMSDAYGEIIDTWWYLEPSLMPYTSLCVNLSSLAARRFWSYCPDFVSDVFSMASLFGDLQKLEPHE